MPREVYCPYCEALAEWVPDSEVYQGRSYGGMIYLCRPCDAYVGCHKHQDGTPGDRPKGRLANAELRKLKIQVHHFFDPIWTAAIEKRGWSRSRARGAAYKWLAANTGIAPADCHVGMMDNAQCKIAIAFLEGFYRAVAEKSSRKIA